MGASEQKGERMVVKTELCNFSGYRIYPGHGRRFIRGDSKPFWFLDSRSHRSFNLKRNPRKLNWTQLYRRLHKKGALEVVTKRRTRRTVKTQRAIEGADLSFIRAKRNQKPEERKKAQAEAAKDLKAQKRKKQQAAKKALPKACGRSKVPAPKTSKSKGR